MAGGAGVVSAPALLLLAVATCCVINSADAARRGRPYSGLVDVDPTVEVIQDAGAYQGRGATKFAMTELYEDVIGGLAAEADPTYYDPWGDAQFVQPQDLSSFQRTRGRQSTTQPPEGVVLTADETPQVERGGRGRSWKTEPRWNRVTQRRSGDEEVELDPAQAAPSINRPRTQPANQVPSEETPRSGGRGPSWRNVGRRGRKEESEEPKATEERVKTRGEESTRSRDVQSRRGADRRRGREGVALDQSTSASIQRSRSRSEGDSVNVEIQQDVGQPETSGGRGGSRRSGRRGDLTSRRTAERRTINEINSINGVEDGVSDGPTITSRGNSGRRNNARGTPRTATSTPTEPTLPGGIRESDNYPQEFIQKLRESTGSTQAASSTTAVAWETPRTRTVSRSTPRSLPDEIPEESPSTPSRDGGARNSRPVTASRRGSSRAQFARIEASEDVTDDRRTPERGSDRGSERGGRRGGRRGESRVAPAPEQDDQSSRRRGGSNRRGSSRRVTTPLAPPAEESSAAPVEVTSSTTSTTTTTQEPPVSSEKTIPVQQDGVAPESSNGASESLKDISRNEESKDNNAQEKLPAVNTAEKVPEVPKSTESAPSSTTASPRDATIGSRLSNFRRTQSRGGQRSGAVAAESTDEAKDPVKEANPREETFRRRGRQRVVSQEPVASSRGSSRDQFRDSGREFSRETSRDSSRDTVRESSRDTNREYSRDSSRDITRGSRRGYSREEPSSSSQAPPPRGRAEFSRGRGLQRTRTTESPSDSLITRASEAVVTVTSSGSAPGQFYRVPERLIATTAEPQRREETRRKLAALTGAKKPPIGKHQAARKTIEENRVVSKLTEDGAKENAVGVNSGEKFPPQRPVFTARKSYTRGTSEAPSPSQGDGGLSGVTPHRFSAKHHRSGDPIRTGSTTATPAYVPTVPSVASGVAPRVSTSPSGQVAPSGWNQRKRPSPKETS